MKPTFDLYPAKAQFRPGEPVTLVLESLSGAPARGELRLAVFRLEREMLRLTVPVTLPPETGRCTVTLPGTWETREDVSVGYGVDAAFVPEREGGAPGEPVALSTAFDVAAHWKLAPRYGFLSDFHPGERGRLADADSLLKYHLNVVQFYDWMYRHDEPVPRTDTFTDPMGRTLSYAVVREKIAALRLRGMASLAYGAVYAALKDFHEAHPDWGLYKVNGDPYELIGRFFLMDLSPDSPWTDKIVSEFRRVIAEAGFDGLHLDQYGFPKRALRRRRSAAGAAGLHGADGRRGAAVPDGAEPCGAGEPETGGQAMEPVDLADGYLRLINRLKRELSPLRPDVGLIFNNVNAYPVHATAAADQEAIYIEVWPPYERYADLKRLIERGRELGQGKHVILAAYLHAFKDAMPEHPAARGITDAGDAEGCAGATVAADDRVSAAETGALLTMATVFASGGFHLALGEDNAVLTEAYYPDHRPLRPAFAAEARRYCDFAVRYAEALYGFDLVDLSMMMTGGVNSEVRFRHPAATFDPRGLPDTVWTMVKRSRDGLLLHLLNLTGVESDRWNEGKPRRPRVLEGIRCEVALETAVTGVYAASPDGGPAALRPLPYTLEDCPDHGKKIVFELPPLRIWTMVRIVTR